MVESEFRYTPKVGSLEFIMVSVAPSSPPVTGTRVPEAVKVTPAYVEVDDEIGLFDGVNAICETCPP